MSDLGQSSMSKKYMNGGMVHGGSFSGNAQGDEQEMVRLRYEQGGRTNTAGLADLYDRTGNMRVARTLAHYQRGGDGLQLGDPNKVAGVPLDRTGPLWDPMGPLNFNPQEQNLSPSERGFFIGDPNKRTGVPDFRIRNLPNPELGLGYREHPFGYKQPPTFGATDILPESNIGLGEYGKDQRRLNIGEGDPIVEGEDVVTGGGGGKKTTPTTTGDKGWLHPEDELRLFEQAINPDTSVSIGEGKTGNIGTSTVPITRKDTPGDQGGRDVDWGNIALTAGTGLLNVLPHALNIRSYRRLPGPLAPALEKAVTLMDPSMEADRQAIIAQGRNVQNQAGFDASQTSQIGANRAAALAKTQSALSRLGGQEQNLITQVRNQNRMANQQTQARNIQRVNKHYEDLTGHELAKIRGIASERGKIAENVLGAIGEGRQMSLDKQRMALTLMGQDITGVMARNAQKIIENPGNYDPSVVRMARQQLGLIGKSE